MDQLFRRCWSEPYACVWMSYARCTYFTAGETEAVRGWERSPQSQQRTELEVAEFFTPPTPVIVAYFFSCFYFTRVASSTGGRRLLGSWTISLYK